MPKPFPDLEKEDYNKFLSEKSPSVTLYKKNQNQEAAKETDSFAMVVTILLLLSSFILGKFKGHH